jgi:uncharacterized protein (UPF0303 family)
VSEQQELLNTLLQQEKELQFSSFTNDDAFKLGVALVEEIRRRGKAAAVDIHRSGQQLFHFAMEGTARDNDEWIKRKNNVVNRFGHSSFYVRRYLAGLGQTIEEKYLVSSHEYAAHGGAFPLLIANVGIVGTVTVSGLPQREDHEVVVTTIRRFLSEQQSK